MQFGLWSSHACIKGRRHRLSVNMLINLLWICLVLTCLPLFRNVTKFGIFHLSVSYICWYYELVIARSSDVSRMQCHIYGSHLWKTQRRQLMNTSTLLLTICLFSLDLGFGAPVRHPVLLLQISSKDGDLIRWLFKHAISDFLVC